MQVHSGGWRKRPSTQQRAAQDNGKPLGSSPVNATIAEWLASFSSIYRYQAPAAARSREPPLARTHRAPCRGSCEEKREFNGIPSGQLHLQAQKMPCEVPVLPGPTLWHSGYCPVLSPPRNCLWMTAGEESSESLTVSHCRNALVHLLHPNSVYSYLQGSRVRCKCSHFKERLCLCSSKTTS